MVNLLKNAFLFVIVAWLPIFLCAKNQVASGEFVITPSDHKRKQHSINTLKEEIGVTTKDIFGHLTTIIRSTGLLQCTLSTGQSSVLESREHQKKCDEILRLYASCNQALGLLLQEIADLQKKCSSIVEKLIDNVAPFKKASKDKLDQLLQTLIAAQRRINNVSNNLDVIHEKLKNNNNDSAQSAAQGSSAADTLQTQVNMLKKTNASLLSDECLKCI